MIPVNRSIDENDLSYQLARCFHFLVARICCQWLYCYCSCCYLSAFVSIFESPRSHSFLSSNCCQLNNTTSPLSLSLHMRDSYLYAQSMRIMPRVRANLPFFSLNSSNLFALWRLFSPAFLTRGYKYRYSY